MGRPIFFAVLIIIVVFLPLFTLQGVEGKLFSPMAFVTLFVFTLLGTEFVPELEEGTLLIRVTANPSISRNEALRIANRLEQTLIKYPEVTYVIRSRAPLGPTARSSLEIYDATFEAAIAKLRRILSAYAAYYNQVRTHLALQKDAPLHRAAQRSGAIVAIPILAGLHHQYVRIRFLERTGG